MNIAALLSPTQPGALSPAKQALRYRAHTPETLSKVARERDLASQQDFRKKLAKSLGMANVSAEHLRLLPDPQTAMAQQSDADKTKKRRYGDSETRGQVQCVKRLAMGGKVTAQDARLVGVSLSLLQDQAYKVVVPRN